MRVQAVGLLPTYERTRAGIAQLQAAMTHAHPTALAASDITAWVIHDLLNNGDVGSLVERCQTYALSQYEVYHDNWLGTLYERAISAPDGESFIAKGWDDINLSLKKVARAMQQPNHNTDPCVTTGEGWIAEEAFATALYCFLLYPDNPMEAIRRGANSSGDSDSIACIAGAFAGAYHGIDAWQSSWLERIEYKQELQSLCNSLTALHSV